MAEFDDATIRIIERRDKAILSAETKLFNSLDPVQQKLFDELKKSINKMNSDGGVLSFDEKNVALVNALDKVMIDAIQKSNYPSSVNEFLREFETIKKFNFDIHKNVNDLSKSELEKLISPIQKQVVDQTMENLTGSGVNSNFIEPVRQGVFKNIVAGSTITDLESSLKTFIQGTGDTDGLLMRYTKQVSRDALNQFDGQTNARIASEFDLDAFRYVGSLIDDSRPQCRRWVAKSVLLRDDLQNEINWAFNNGSGMNKATTPDNFAVYRGGYSCRHSAIPFKMTKSQREKYNTPEEQQKIEAKADAATDGIGQPRAARDFVDLYGFKSSLTPASIKDLQGVPQQIFELSNNGELKRMSGERAFYTPFKKTVEVGTGSRYQNDLAFKKVIVHEFGHRIHFEQKFFRFETDENPEHEKYFQDSKKIWTKKFKSGYSLDSSIFSKYQKKFKGVYSNNEIDELATAYADTIEALTAGRHGWGHGKTYQTRNRGCMARMEWFAHASENYWLGNPIFELEFPELYGQMNEYYFKMVIEPLVPKRLLK